MQSLVSRRFLSQTTLRRLVSPLLSFVAVFSIAATSAVADERRPGSRKLFQRTATAAVQSNNNERRVNRQELHALTNDALRLNDDEPLAFGYKKENRMISFYRGIIYSKYFKEDTGADNFADLESRELAEDLLIYQGTKTLSWLFDESPLAKIYEDFVATYKQYTAVNIDRSPEGSLRFTSPGKGKRKLLQLKLHVSSARGIEPRLVIEDRLTLRYDLLHQMALFEYQVNF